MEGMPVNFMNDIDDSRVRATFGPEKYQRLVELKRRWDPNNVFSMNQNIAP
jgi:FAD/FMN-containing dehydrogenase